ncbi:MAG TPA: hypothetical protein VHB77_17325 [Planctomycetaceae bacterium]|nr:hypothetical protein [Planctomycetaceae bacterium]
MQPSAKITVNSGPDRGKLLEIAADLVRIGRADDNDLVLTDGTLDDYQLSIIERNGRHAVYTLKPDQVEVDGVHIPAERWVWLPEVAQIRLSPRTAVEFISLVQTDSNGDEKPADIDFPAPPEDSPLRKSRSAQTERESAAVGLAEPSSPPTAAPPAGKTKRSGTKNAKTRDKSSQTVARFITDQAGDPLVKLGEDGHYPELKLAEGQDPRPTPAAQQQKSNPLVLVAAFCVSVGMSLSLLMLDATGPSAASQKKDVARKVITFYYGDESRPLEPYQVELREARQASSQGRYDIERRRLRDVLAMLRSERKNPFTGLCALDRSVQMQFEGLTISELDALGPNFLELSSDDKLSRLIAILLDRN